MSGPALAPAAGKRRSGPSEQWLADNLFFLKKDYLEIEHIKIHNQWR
jgi:hypothetical protein